MIILKIRQKATRHKFEVRCSFLEDACHFHKHRLKTKKAVPHPLCVCVCLHVHVCVCFFVRGEMSGREKRSINVTNRSFSHGIKCECLFKLLTWVMGWGGIQECSGYGMGPTVRGSVKGRR